MLAMLERQKIKMPTLFQRDDGFGTMEGNKKDFYFGENMRKTIRIVKLSLGKQFEL